MFKRYDRFLTEFDDQLWYATIDTVTVESKDKLIFRFKNGEKIVVNMD